MTWISYKWKIKFKYSKLKINWIRMEMKESMWIKTDIKWSGKTKINKENIYHAYVNLSKEWLILNWKLNIANIF